MALIFLSDVHLRRSRPERGRRLAALMETLDRNDRVVVVGDLCDFWFASRESGAIHPPCPGLRGLAAFRARGGRLHLLPGNHDAWLGPFYQDVLGVGYAGRSLDIVVNGVRFRAIHGHEIGARRAWKGVMEARWFLRAFRALPGPLARMMDSLLDSTNRAQRDATNFNHKAIYRTAADRFREEVDVCVFGHIHTTHDDPLPRPRVIVLGGWHDRSSYLRVSDTGEAVLVIVEDPA